MEIKVAVYEDNGGGIHAIVRDGERIANVLTGFQDGALSTEDFLDAAKGGFCYADKYDPDNFSGASLEECAAEIESRDELIAEIGGGGIEIYPDRMGIAGRILFGVNDEY